MKYDPSMAEFAKKRVSLYRAKAASIARLGLLNWIMKQEFC